MFIYIVRHAWAGHHGDPGWADDSLRELSAEGKERFASVVQALAERGFAPQRIATSPYARCRQTADIVAQFVSGEPDVVELETLEPGSNLDELIEWTNAQEGRDVCWVGHNPDIEELAGLLIAESMACIRFAKGAVAAVQFDELAEVGAGELCWLATAKSLGL
jgi:phosphohistidine phosphatase